MAVRRLVQRVERQPTARISDRRLELALSTVAAHKPLQRAGQVAAQPLGLEELPLVEVRAVAQAEAGHKVVVVQRRRLGQRVQAARADLGGRVVVRAASRQSARELVYVDPERLAAAQADRLAVDLQPFPTAPLAATP